MLRHPETFIRRLLTLFLCTAVGSVVLLSGCAKDDCVGSEVDITDYLAANDSTGRATQLEGLYYIIEEPGDTVRPQLTDTVVVTYQGFTTEDESFDETGEMPVAFLLDDLIRAWQIGLPLIGQGGRIRLFVPSRLAYASNQAGNLCPSSDIIFDINLVDVR